MRADPRQVVPPRLRPHHTDEAIEPLRRDGIVDMIGEPHRRRSLAHRILEGVRLVEIGVGHQRQRLGELRFGLPRETDDEVGADGEAGNRRPQLARHLEIPLPGVPPQHPPEHRVRAALRRQVHVLAHRVDLGHRRDDPRR